MARAGAESRLNFKVSGTIQAIPVQVGDRVKPGTLIAQLEEHETLDREDIEAVLGQRPEAVTG